MSIWDYLFDTDHDHALDLRSIQEDTRALHAAVDTLGALRRDLAQAQQQIDRLQLVTEALVSLLELRSGIERNELSLMIQRLDLADGVEDNRLGPDRSSQAPKCPHCGRPINPKRDRCIYCFSAAGDRTSDHGDAAAAARKVSCAKCGANVSETAVYFSDEGLLCAKCCGVRS
jgi:hypothetical protein